MVIVVVIICYIPLIKNSKKVVFYSSRFFCSTGICHNTKRIK